MKLKVLVYSLTFYPDHSGISKYSSDFAFYAAEKGHSVEVITGYPFYPQWKKGKEDERKIFSINFQNGVKIYRSYLYVPEKPTTFKRLIQEFTFLVSTFFSFFRVSRPDVIVVFTTPISIGFLASLFKTFWNSKLIINVQDFQLEAASSLGMVEKNILFRFVEKIENFSYKRSNYVSSISESMFDLLKQRKQIPSEKLLLWPNWIDPKEVELDPSRKGIFRKKNDLACEDILIAYAGNIGLKQGLEIFVDLAKKFEEKEQLKFLLIGEGAALDELRSYASNRSTSNLIFLPFLNELEYKDFLNDLDIFFMSQKRTPFDIYFPSKLLGLMAAGKTLMLCADKDSELYKTVNDNEIGLTFEYGDLDTLVNHVEEVIGDKNITETVRISADRYVSQFYRKNVLSKIFLLIEDLSSAKHLRQKKVFSAK